MKTQYEWKSDVSKIIQEYLSVKKMTGFKFETHERYLRHFDSYHFHNGYTGTHLTKLMLEAFIYKKEERAWTHYNKEVVMSQFTIYLNSHGIPAYVPEVNSRPPRSNHIPHIYTKEELQRFFRATDEFPEVNHPNRKIVDPVLFRFLYGTGTRLSEALNLKLNDVNLSEGTVYIRNAKNNKDRLIPMATGLTKRMKNFIDRFHKLSDCDGFVFPSREKGRLDNSTAYLRFRDYLWMADIPHTNSGPRIHDFRHTYSVNCLKKWSLQGMELSNALPYLAAYLGHADFRGTQYYLRLTADLFPHIISKTEAEFGYVIPEGEFKYEKS
jgi:Site-specific recombinase XerD